MASLTINGLTDLQIDLRSVIELPQSVKSEMLTAEAEITIRAQESTARSMGVYDAGQRYPSKHLADSSKQTKVYYNDDGASTYVYPHGSRTRAGTTTRQGEIAFINEFGKTGQAARPFIRTANEKCADEAVNAALKVYDNFLKKKNL